MENKIQDHDRFCKICFLVKREKLKKARQTWCRDVEKFTIPKKRFVSMIIVL